MVFLTSQDVSKILTKLGPNLRGQAFPNVFVPTSWRAPNQPISKPAYTHITHFLWFLHTSLYKPLWNRVICKLQTFKLIYRHRQQDPTIWNHWTPTKVPPTNFAPIWLPDTWPVEGIDEQKHSVKGWTFTKRVFWTDTLSLANTLRRKK